MNDLGPLFKTQSIKGPIIVNYFVFQQAHIYLIGEEHNTNGDPQNQSAHAIDVIRDYGEKHRIRCYIESSLEHSRQCSEVMNYLLSQEISAPAPLYGYCSYWWKGLFSEKNHTNVFSDVRKIAPYDIYTLITDPRVYMFKEGSGLTYTQETEVKVRKLAKRVEKDIYKHISSREKAKIFFKSFYHPDMSYPDWYIELYKIANKTDAPPSDVLRVKMSELKMRSQSVYDTLLTYIDSLVTKWAVTPYTNAFKKMESMRNTKQSKLVAENRQEVYAVLVELTSFLLDLFVISDILLKPTRKDDIIVVLTGAAHTLNMSHFFGKYASVFYKYNVKGNIPSGEASQGVGVMTNKIWDDLEKIRML
jgi:hypothetical protein